MTRNLLYICKIFFYFKFTTMKLSFRILLTLCLPALLQSCYQEDNLRALSTNVEDSIEEIVEYTDSVEVNLFEINRVINFHRNQFGKKNSRSELTTMSMIKDDEGKPVAYVVNFSNEQGWIIISATKKYYPIVAYNESGNFNLDDMPTPVAAWTEDLKYTYSS